MNARHRLRLSSSPALISCLALCCALATAEPYIPQAAREKGECSAYWRTRRFSAEAEDPLRRTLFDPFGGESYGSFLRRIERAKCYKEWLIVIYMAGDNDLSPFSYRDLWEMQAAGSEVSVDVVAFHVSAKERGARYYHVAYVPPSRQPDYRDDILARLERDPEYAALDATEQRKRYDAEEITYLNENGPALIKSPKVREVRDADPAANKSLDDFLSWAFSNYPTKRVLFMGWGHGKGFDTAAPPPPGTETPARTGNVMPVTEMVNVLRDKVEEHRGGKQLDIAGSDSCLNQQVEFGYQWRGLADYVFGSSTIVQKKGFNYKTLLDWLGSHPKFATVDTARQIPALYRGSVLAGANRKYSGYYDPYATMGVWTTAELRLLKNALDGLADEAFRWIADGEDEDERIERASELKKTLRKGERLGGVSYDLFDMLLKLLEWIDKEKARAADPAPWLRLHQRANAVSDAINRAVLEKFIGPHYIAGLTLRSKGVAVWVPDTEREFQTMYRRFETSRFYRDEAQPARLGSWGKLIGRLYGDLRE